MSLKGLRKIIQWLRESNVDKVKLAGGEPLLHPDLLDFVNELSKNNITLDGILTNGLGDTELYKQVASITETNWLVNVTNPQTYTEEEWELLNTNLETLKWKNADRSVKEYGFDTSGLRRLCLSITFYEPNQDSSYIIELAKRYRCPVIRYDVSRPSSDKSNVHVNFDGLHAIKPTLMRFIRRCVHEGVKPGLDCALPLCIFTQEELMFLALFSNFYAICTPHLDVMPDLAVEYCTSMRGILPSYKIQKIPASQIFSELFSHANKHREYELSRCSNCYNYAKRLCQGYCLRLKSDFLEQKQKFETKMRNQIRWPKFWR